MAFDFNFLSRGGGTSPAPIVYTYESSTDTISTITAAGYFNNAFTTLNVGDWIIASASDTENTFRVTASSKNGVTAIANSFSGVTDNCRLGWEHYADVTTDTTPIPVTAAGGFVFLTNDGQDTATNTLFGPAGVDQLYLTSTNSFDFTGLEFSTIVNIRVDMDAVTSAPNQDIVLELRLGIGAGEFSQTYIDTTYRTAGTHRLTILNSLFIGDSNLKDNPARFRVSSSNDADITVRGFLIEAYLRG